MKKTNKTISPAVEWDKIHPILTKLGLQCEDSIASEHLVELAKLYEYQPHAISTYGTINDEPLIGVVVTHNNQEVDNGIYVFHASASGSVMLSVVQPSTIDRQHIINRTVLNIEMMLADTDMPTLTPDDIVRATYELLKRQICDASAKAQHLPEDKQDAYSKIYMDLLLHNLHLYHMQDTAYQESVINDQPNRIRTMLLHSDEADNLSKEVMKDVAKVVDEQNNATINGTLLC